MGPMDADRVRAHTRVQLHDDIAWRVMVPALSCSLTSNRLEHKSSHNDHEQGHCTSRPCTQVLCRGHTCRMVLSRRSRWMQSCMQTLWWSAHVFFF